MDAPGHCLHPPGTPALSGVLDVGLRCPHSCRFCYYSFHGGAAEQFAPLRRAPLRSTENCLRILDIFAQQRFKRFDVTGGEPTMHPGLVEVIRHGCRELGLAARVITLGQLLARPGAACGKYLLDDLLDAGLTDFLFSMHAADEERFRAFTGGSLERQLRTMRHLERQGVQFCANTVVFQDSVPLLPDIARLSATRGVYAHNFILFNAYHAWSAPGRAAGVQAGYREIEPLLRQAVEILTSAGVAVNIRFAPLCAFPGLERHVVGVLGQPFDPCEWRNRACNVEREPEYCAQAIDLPASGVRPEHAYAPLEETLPNGVRATGQRGQHFKLFARPCAQCAARPACDGLDAGYLERYGDGELLPFDSARLRGPLLEERLEYAPAFLVKLAQKEDMRALVRTMG